MIKSLEQKCFILAETIASISILTAIRSAFVVTLPLVVIGSLAELMNSFPLAEYKFFMVEVFGDNWRMFGQGIKNGTTAMMSLIMLFSIGQHIAERFNADNPLLSINPVLMGLISFASFVCLLQGNPQEGFLINRWFGVSGLLLAIIVAVMASSFFLFLYKHPLLRFRLTGGTPDIAISQTFMGIIPAMLTVASAGIIGLIFYWLTGITVHESAYKIIRMPFDTMQHFGRGLFYIFSLQILWFFGIHGANILDPITHDIYGVAMHANALAALAGEPLPHIMTKTFMDTFVFMGGSGTTICLALALIIFGKTQGNRKLGIISLALGLFNINEVLLFGLPLILNPFLFIPFVLTPFVLAILSYGVLWIGLVPGTSVALEWTTPILLNGYLVTGSVSGIMLQIFNILIGFLIYMPFVLLITRIHEQRMQLAFKKLLVRACSTTEEFSHAMNHHDEVGALAWALQTDLQHDLTIDKGALFLNFQPQVSATTTRVTGAEALIRWKHEVYGLIPAPIIIAIAENTGLIVPLGEWVFEKACDVRRHWLDYGINDIAIAVNFSGLQFLEQLPDRLDLILARYDLQHAMIEIEVTESTTLDDDKPESRIISELYDRGFPISIDDFGMGHSSLKYLKQFPVSAIKIDGGIIKDVENNPICADIVTSITRLCRTRNMHSIAEFVETDSQVTLLRSLGCDIFQGYKYSKPLDAETCLQFILNNHAQYLTTGLSSHKSEQLRADYNVK